MGHEVDSPRILWEVIRGSWHGTLPATVSGHMIGTVSWNCLSIGFQEVTAQSELEFVDTAVGSPRLDKCPLSPKKTERSPPGPHPRHHLSLRAHFDQAERPS